MANYLQQFYLDFRNGTGQRVKITLSRKNFRGVPAAYDGNDAPAELEYPIADSRDNALHKFAPVRGSAYNFGAISSAAFTAKKALYTEDDQGMVVAEELDGSLSWRGYLAPYLSKEDYSSEPYQIQGTATDAVGMLSTIRFVGADGFGIEERISVSAALSLIVSKLGTSLGLVTSCPFFGESMDQAVDPLSQTYFDARRFTDNDGEPVYCDEVLRALMECFGLVFFQNAGYWYAVSLHTYANEELPTLYRYDAAGVYAGAEVGDVTALVENAKNDPDSIVVVAQNPQTERIPSAKQVTFEVEYGGGKNRLYNAKFGVIDPTVSGGQAARGWRMYDGNYEYKTPDTGATLYRSNYLEYTGHASSEQGRDDIGVYRAWDSSNNGPATAVIRPRSLDMVLHMSAPIIVPAFKSVTFSGEYLNIGTRGVKVQIVATPVVDESIVAALKADPLYQPTYAQERHPFPQFADNSGDWQTLQGTALTFENTQQLLDPTDTGSNPKTVVISKNEWASFSVDTAPILRKREWPGGTTVSANYYAIRIVIFRGLAYQDPKPKNPGPERVKFRNLFVTYKDAGIQHVIVKERVILEQVVQLGRKLSVQTVKLGSVGGEDYYSQLLDASGEPITRWQRKDKLLQFPVYQLTAQAWLNQYRKPSLKFEGVLMGAGTGYDRRYVFEGIPDVRYFFTHGMRLSRRYAQNSSTLVELLKGDAAHNYSRFNVDDQGRSVLVDGGFIGGDVEEDDPTALKITFLEPNGLSIYYDQVYGPNVTGGFSRPCEWYELAWYDPDDAGPYTITSVLKNATFDYSRTWTVPAGTYRTEIYIPQPLSTTVTVTNSQGKTAAKATKGVFNKLRALTISPTCTGDAPGVSAVMFGLVKPYRLAYVNREFGGEQYRVEVVDLITGKVVASKNASEVIHDWDNNAILSSFQVDWETTTYGVRIIGTIEGDYCGQFSVIARCTEPHPNYYSGDFSDRYKKMTN